VTGPPWSACSSVSPPGQDSACKWVAEPRRLGGWQCEAAWNCPGLPRHVGPIPVTRALSLVSWRLVSFEFALGDVRGTRTLHCAPSLNVEAHE
jgi:hypothetical protein